MKRSLNRSIVGTLGCVCLVGATGCDKELIQLLGADSALADISYKSVFTPLRYAVRLGTDGNPGVRVPWADTADMDETSYAPPSDMGAGDRHFHGFLGCPAMGEISGMFSNGAFDNAQAGSADEGTDHSGALGSY